MKETGMVKAANHLSKIHLTKKKQHKSPSKTKRSKSFVKLPSVKNTIFIQHQNYSIGEVLGEGAYAKVHLAYRKIDGIKCVIKVYEKHRLKTETRKEGLLKEIQLLQKVQHPHLIQFLDFYETADSYNIVMEYFSANSLSNFVKTNRPLKIETLQNITKQLATGLAYLHSKGMAHRDMKPENILIDSDLQVKIIDLGFAMRGDEIQVKVAGTPQYMCPELIQGKSFNPFKADVWSLGIMLYWLSLGYFPQDTDQRKKKNMIKGVKINKVEKNSFQLRFPLDMNPGLEYLISKMLKVNPEERIEAEQILEDTWIKPKCLKSQIEKLRLSKALTRL